MGDIEFFVNTQLEHAGFINAFSTRSAGTAATAENRARLLSAAGAANSTLVISRQVHSADLRIVRDLNDARSEPVTGDALTSELKGVTLGVQTADCLPLLIGDQRTGAFAAVHAGWRGTLKGILARTIEAMQHEFETRSADAIVAIGPGLQQCCFEVGSEVEEAFRNQFTYGTSLFSRKSSNEKGHLDLVEANIRQLAEMGVSRDRIYMSDLCTKCRTDIFFSHRDGRTPGARMIGVIGR